MNKIMPSIPDVSIKMLLAGEMRCVLNEGTDREVDTGWFRNLIVDSGLDRLGSTANPGIFTWTSIGTGTNAPANSDTSLQAYVASANTVQQDSQGNTGPSTYASQCQMHWVYAQGAVVGNMAEIGVGWASGGGSLFSRARILDSGGSPTTLTVVSLDQLTVYYKLTCTPQITDLTSTVTISGTGYNYTGRLANAASFFANMFAALQTGGARWGQGSSAGGHCLHAYSTQTLGAITSVPAGTDSSGGGGSASLGSYTAGQKYLDNVFTAIPSECNSSGGVGSIMLEFTNSQHQFQYSLAQTSGGAVLPKDNTKTFTITARFAWDRV